MAEDTRAEFEDACKFVRGIVGKVGKDDLLYFYARFKQATEGACTAPKPSFYQLTEKSKWQAWMELGDMSGEEARVQYIERFGSSSKHNNIEYIELSSKNSIISETRLFCLIFDGVNEYIPYSSAVQGFGFIVR